MGLLAWLRQQWTVRPVEVEQEEDLQEQIRTALRMGL